MKTALTIALLLACAAASAQTYVAPSVDRNGNYREGHYRSAPNNTERDNYGTRGNYNPYTGSAGTRTPKEDRGYGQSCGYNASGRYVCR